MKKTLAILVAGIALVLGVVWWGGSRDIETPSALEPVPEDVLSATTDEAAASEGRRRSAAIGLPDWVDPGDAAAAGGGPALDLPLEAASTLPVTDFARTPPEPTGDGIQAWLFDERATWTEHEDGGVQLKLELTGENGPSVGDPWIVRLWGIEAGSVPKALGGDRFTGEEPGVLSIEASQLAHYDQVFALRAAWREELPRFVAAFASAAFVAEDGTLECPANADEPCTVLAWWKLEADGSFGLKRMPLPQGQSVFVQGRYASLFSLE